ncbi:hypothetical protein BABINDRAFT_160105 [Babjeviella inositovora NRRL Y-12698]|uniref:Uncharacterized protein n=1 Tax=Babjeviella inositovora NRRL Y-12698 TaxID=984486 RepID=A0A1E3QW32_9ASCO|nr:uncharacterized protein BABINDRAFT_160105 [Babjeviella inositovora NRRL Y-12698]ODQ81875.1 hypothetical protein BABINDRAFT_160105 [Babjeviella inositovora NRRL Y-12698]
MAPQFKREELVVPYVHHPAPARNDVSGTISQTLPMAAMFMRNKMLSWASLFLALQAYLNEPKYKVAKKEASTPPLMAIGLAAVSLVMCYMELVFPQSGSNQASQFAKQAAETAATTASSIVSAVTSA